MSLFEERLADLPLNVERYALEGLTRDVSSAFTRASTVIRMHGAGEEGAGEDVTYDAPDHEVLQAAGPVLPLAGEWTLGSFCDHVEALDLWPAPPQHEASRLYRVPTSRPRSTSRCARRARRCTPRWAAKRARCASSSRCASASRRPSTPWSNAWSATRRCGSSSTRPASGPPRSSPGWWPPARSTRSTSRAITSARSSTRPPIPSSAGAWSRPSPPPGSRTRSSPRRPTRSSSPIATASPGMPPSTASRTSRHCPSRRGWSTSSRRAWGRCAPCSAPMSTARHAGSGCTAAGSSSSAPAAVRSNLASVFHPDTPNDVAPGGYNAPDAPAGLPDSPLAPMAHDTGFRWG